MASSGQIERILDAVSLRQPEEARRVLGPYLDGDQTVLVDHVIAALQDAPCPDAAVLRLGRYMDAGDGEAVLGRIAHHLAYAKFLFRVLAQSAYLTTIACKHPEFVEYAWRAVSFGENPTAEQLRREALDRCGRASGFDAECRELRLLKQREGLRIGARDVAAHDALEDVVEDWSHVADACVEAGVDCAQRAMGERYGRPLEPDGSEAGFCVLALGKLGGFELNFSSDIDLIFIYSQEGETEGGSTRRLSNGEYFTKVGEYLIKALAENRQGGHVFRVDMRLRPHGTRSPLAATLDNCLHYYERYGRAWERQALIRTRPIAGDKELGRHFVDETRPFVFPRYFDDDTLEDIRQVKAQLEASVLQTGKADSEIKLGRGGIRDIEHTVQMLQLLNGGRVEGLRVPNTLKAIRALGGQGLLSPFEADTLRSNYVFMRIAENRLQLEQSQQKHALPKPGPDLDDFARRMGYPDGEAFMRVYRDRTQSSREILERFYAKEGAGNRWIIDLLNPESPADNAKERLASMGFQDPQGARECLMRMHAGRAETPHSLHVRQRFMEVVPALLEALSTVADPGESLMRLERLLGNLKAPGAIYDLLATYQDLCYALVRVAANSEYLTQILIRDPGLFETIATGGELDHEHDRDDLEAQLNWLRGALHSEAALYRLHDGEVLRTGMREILRDLDVAEVGRSLTLLAEVILSDVVRQAREEVADRYGPTEARFAVLGLGKLGGREMGYGSDLDLLFVYESHADTGEKATPIEYFSAVASNAIKKLKERTRHGVLYDIDARLRPDGRKGTLAINDERFAEYYRERAQAWERLALVKARYVAGDAEFGARIEEQAGAIAYAAPLTPEELSETERIRQKLAEKAAPLDLKKGEGGIAEIEFALRILQIQRGVERPEVRRPDALGAIEALQACGGLSDDDAATLASAYRLLRRIENRIRMMHGQSASELPPDAEARTSLAARLGIDGDIAEVVGAAREKVHAIYQNALERYGGG